MQKVTYKKWIGIFLVVCAVLLMVSTIVLGVTYNTFTGTMGMVFGVLYLTKPAIEYNDEDIMVKNMFGKTMKQFSVKTDKIEIKDGIAYANDKKLFPGYKSLNSDEYAKLLNYIGAIKK